ncbi:hypothetical protein CHS0354_037498 [Potamilus streckersoni]|uniref:Fibronectin type-III domain-containing protein n=1 Tax=Potamilus streckersoni TaxID=2493646 RepID=A0AAE0RPE0_9BIVA|nr:hypothetical protein CHS0354_037498 [Potamilus streckersoni]
MAVNAEGQSEPLQTSRSVKAFRKIDPPNTPTFVKCSIVGINRVELQWDTSMSDDGAQITGYEIYKATSAAPDWKYLTEVKGKKTLLRGRSITLLLLPRMMLVSANSVKWTNLSDCRNDSQHHLHQLALKVIDIQHDGFTLTWNPRINDVNSPVIAHVIEQRESYRQTWSIIKHTGPNEHKLVLDGLQEGQEYYFRVSAENTIGRS